MKSKLTLDNVILATIALNDNAIRGKTLLQKIIYFISVKLNLDFGYNPHYYGPYSPLVDNHLTKLVMSNFIKEEIFIWGEDDKMGFEKKKFEYSLSKQGLSVYKLLEKKYKKEFENVKDIIEDMSRSDVTKDYLSLSVAAKTHFIVSHSQSKMNKSSITRAAKSLGWNISEKSVDNAGKFLSDMKLLK